MNKTLIKIVIALSLIVLGLLWRNVTALAEAPAPEIVAPVTDPLFEKIAYCESKNDPKAQNPYSTADGRFQFLDGSWKYYGQKLWGDSWVEKDKFSYQDSTDLAWYVYTNFGTSDWSADPKSYECWKSEIPNGTYKNTL